MIIIYKNNSVKYQTDRVLFNAIQITPFTPQGTQNPCMFYSVILYADLKARHLKVSRKSFISIDIGFSLQLANMTSTSGTITVDVLNGAKMTEWDFKLMIQNLERAKVNFYSNGVIIDTGIRRKECGVENGILRIEALQEEFKIDNKTIVTIPKIVM